MSIDFKEFYNWAGVPGDQRTKKQWLKERRRVKKDAHPVGKIHLIFDKPRDRPRGVNPVPPEECKAIRDKWASFGPDQSDQWDLYRLRRAGQLASSYLYPIQDTEEITSFTEAEAVELLGYMMWDGSHEDHYIIEQPLEDGRKRATWKSEFSMPDMKAHLAGERYYGTKRGQSTMLITVDLDRHQETVNGTEHINKVLKAGEVLTSSFPHLRFAPEVNPRNGSVKFFGWLNEPVPVWMAKRRAEQVRAELQGKLPEYDFSTTEIFPSTCPQVFAPLRADKIMVIGSGVVQKIKRWKGKKERHYYDAYSCADYLNWVYFSKEPYDSATFEQRLWQAVASLPDLPPGQAPEPKQEKKCKAKRKPSTGEGMGSIGRLKGRCASALVEFWSELERPEDDTIGKYLIVTLRVLKHEGLDRDEAVDWVEERLEALEYKEFSDRLADDFGELLRTVDAAATAVWEGNGYQKDPGLSEVKLKAAVDAWAKRGFFLHDPRTWHKAHSVRTPEVKLIWTTALITLIPGLAAIAHCSHECARQFLEMALGFVQENNELSESMVGRLLERCGIKGKSRGKQYEVRKFLVGQGLLIKQRNYFCDQATGYRHGNFYVCGLAVEFQEEAAHTPHTVSIYLSLNMGCGDEEEAHGRWVVMEQRRLTCERRYQERRRSIITSLRQAA